LWLIYFTLLNLNSMQVSLLIIWYYKVVGDSTFWLLDVLPILMTTATYVYLQGQFSYCLNVARWETCMRQQNLCSAPHLPVGRILRCLIIWKCDYQCKVCHIVTLLWTQRHQFSSKWWQNKFTTTLPLQTWVHDPMASATPTKSQTVDKFTILYELKQVSVSLCHHSLLLNGFAQNTHCLTPGILRTDTGQQTCSFAVYNFRLFAASCFKLRLPSG
jgi:hypothetical protein